MPAGIELSPYEWNVEVDWDEAGGFAYRPGEVIVRGEAAETFVQKLLTQRGIRFEHERFDRALARALSPDSGDERELGDELADLLSGPTSWARFTDVPDPLKIVRAARAAGHVAQPNHVLFADNCGCGDPYCPPHPSLANDLDGLVGNPLRANPLRANPLRANPLRANPLRANPLRANQPPVNSAVPAGGRQTPVISFPDGKPMPRVVVFDTGCDMGATRPDLINQAAPAGDAEVPDEVPPPGGDKYLDPVSGHGTFIIGLLEQLCPGLEIHIRGVIEPMGSASEFDLSVQMIAQIVVDWINGESDRWPHTMFSMSLSGYVLDPDAFLREMVTLVQFLGVVVAASVGNTGSCRPAYPAAFSDVVSVGALGPCGPAEFTSYGSWVRACAPGVDLVSAFFLFDGANVAINGVDPDDFHGWAMWSGTSFSVPVVVAALARQMRLGKVTANEAVAQVIEADHLARIPCLGTIVNM